MSKNILIFSDGTGQIGGMRPDQRLSNVYKMYQAMRPGPASQIKPTDQICFYDPGLGTGEVEGLTFRKIKNILSQAFGAGIDENVIDCYEKVISYYEPGDRVLLFGFSRGAYTARAVSSVMNLCGVPTKMPDGSAVPKYGERLRKIASDAVNYVYNHGNGYRRGEEPYFAQREELGRRFRVKYGSSVPNAEPDVQGNVQPTFIGVFDTVAALGNMFVNYGIGIVVFLLFGMLAAAYLLSWLWFAFTLIIGPLIVFSYWYLKLRLSQFKYYSPDSERPLKRSNPLHWWSILKYGHRAIWKLENYDKSLDADVGFARHAMAIDEQRRDFPRVQWGMPAEALKNKDKNPVWLKQVWFPGCHSDIGGSYLEPESRLSDIALDWMIAELKECVPEIQINENILVRSPDPTGLQHEETYQFEWGPFKKRWAVKPRIVDKIFTLHKSVFERLGAEKVQQLDEVKPYRPAQLKDHPDAKDFYVK